MLKHRNYLLISFFFILIFFLFQVVVYDSAVSTAVISNETALAKLDKEIDTSVLGSETTPVNLVITGSTDDGLRIGRDLQASYGYLKQPALIYKTIDEVPEENLNSYYSLSISTNNVDEIGSIDTLLEYIYNGGHVIFTQLPSKRCANYSKIEKIIGIVSNGKEYEQKGFEIWEGLLIGGPYAAEKTKFMTSEIKLYGSCKTYGVCTDKEILKNEDKNPVAWRTFYNNGGIFVVNAPFMKEKSGMGMLAAFISDLHDDYLYPVINGKATILNNFPYMTSKNDDLLKERYNRDMKDFTRDIMWSDLVSIMRDSSLAYTCYTAQADYGNSKEYNQSMLEFLSRELNKNKGEIGYTLPKGSGAFAATMRRDSDFFARAFENYNIKSYSDKLEASFEQNKAEILGNFPQINTVLSDLNSVDVAVIDKQRQIVTVPYTSTGFYSTDEERWSLANMVTALGLVTHEMDMDIPIMDKDMQTDGWRVASVEVAKYLNWQKWKYGWMPSYKMSDLSIKIRNYLYMNVDITYGEEDIICKIQNFGKNGEAFFILRTDKRIINCTDCEIIKARSDEPGLYIIKALKGEFTITTTHDDN